MQLCWFFPVLKDVGLRTICKVEVISLPKNHTFIIKIIAKKSLYFVDIKTSGLLSVLSRNIIAYYDNNRCVKCVRIRSFSGLFFPTLGLNMEIYEVSLRIQSECGKIPTRKTRNIDTSQAVNTIGCCVEKKERISVAVINYSLESVFIIPYVRNSCQKNFGGFTVKYTW